MGTVKTDKTKWKGKVIKPSHDRNTTRTQLFGKSGGKKIIPFRKK